MKSEPLLCAKSNAVRSRSVSSSDYRIGADVDASHAVADLASRNFDAAVVDGDDVLRFVLRETLEGRPGTVGDHARPLTSRELMSADTGLTEAIQRLGRQQVLFVLGRGGISGVVTRADLQRPAAAMVVLALLLAAEADLRQLIEGQAGDRWREVLAATRLVRIREVFEQRRASNSEIAELDCLTLTDRLEVVRCLPELRTLLGLSSKRDAERLKKELQEVRDCLAHGGDLLTAANGGPQQELPRS